MKRFLRHRSVDLIPTDIEMLLCTIAEQSQLKPFDSMALPCTTSFRIVQDSTLNAQQAHPMLPN